MPERFTNSVPGGVSRSAPGVDAQCVLYSCNSARDIAVLHEGAHEQPVLVAGCLHDEVALIGQRAVVARWHEQVLPALALVRAGYAQIGHVALIGVVQETEYTLRRLHHQRACLEVGAVQHVDRRRVRRQDQRAGIDQVLHYADCLATDPGLREAAAHPEDRGCRDAVEKGGYAPHKVEIVVDQPHSRPVVFPPYFVLGISNLIAAS